MPSLKDLRVRIGSVKNTQQITSTMKMVAAAKVRRARMNCEEARPFAEKLGSVLANLAKGVGAGGPVLLRGRDEVKTVRYVVFGSDRGLCAGFNGNLCKTVELELQAIQAAGKKLQIVCVGRKIRDILKVDYADDIVEVIEDLSQDLTYTAASEIGTKQLAAFEDGTCDEVHIAYNRFVSMMTQDPLSQQLIPFKVNKLADKEGAIAAAIEYEPEESVILGELLPRNLNTQVFRAMLESAASEHAARMTAMDNATRNAGEMIKDLSLQYNRTRQAVITTELIEIIAGAEAV